MSQADYTVYLVTDAPERYTNGLLTGVEQALAGGVSMVQYRATAGTRRHLYATACALRDLLRPRGVPLIINDQVDLAMAVDAEGVHVGQNDLPVSVARRLLGPGKLIGLSITAPDQLSSVPAGAVDYLGLGPVFPTISKDDAAPALGLELLDQMTKNCHLPTVAIGGINLENAPKVFAAGVDGVAVVSAFSLSSDPASVARSLRSAKSQRP
ncbi:MAG: thiamine phosphate synthase [Nibricoccus sp.]